MGRRLIVLAVCGSLAAACFAWLRPIPLGGDASYVIVRGTSMEPTYRDGDLVLATRGGSYRPGDVVAFRVDGRFHDPAIVIHRIVGGNRHDGYVTQGDNRDRTDPWTPREANVLGRAVFRVPYVGNVADALSSPWVFAALGVALVLSDGSRRRRERRAVVRRRQAVPGSAALARIDWKPM